MIESLILLIAMVGANPSPPKGLPPYKMLDLVMLPNFERMYNDAEARRYFNNYLLDRWGVEKLLNYQMKTSGDSFPGIDKSAMGVVIKKRMRNQLKIQQDLVEATSMNVWVWPDVNKTEESRALCNELGEITYGDKIFFFVTITKDVISAYFKLVDSEFVRRIQIKVIETDKNTK